VNTVARETGATEIMRELSVRKAQLYGRPGLEKCVSYLQGAVVRVTRAPELRELPTCKAQ